MTGGIARSNEGLHRGAVPTPQLSLVVMQRSILQRTSAKRVVVVKVPASPPELLQVGTHVEDTQAQTKAIHSLQETYGKRISYLFPVTYDVADWRDYTGQTIKGVRTEKGQTSPIGEVSRAMRHLLIEPLSDPRPPPPVLLRFMMLPGNEGLGA